MKHPVVETTIEFFAHPYQVRLWVDRTDDPPTPNSLARDVQQGTKSFLGSSEQITPDDLIAFLAESVPKLAAVQVIDRESVPEMGVVAYIIWP